MKQIKEKAWEAVAYEKSEKSLPDTNTIIRYLTKSVSQREIKKTFFFLMSSSGK